MTLNTPVPSPLYVDLSFSLIAHRLPNGTASAADYQATDRRRTVAVGITSLLVNLHFMGDPNVKSQWEFFYPSLSNPSSGAKLSTTSSAAKIIISDDHQGLTINHSSASTGLNPLSGSNKPESITGSPYRDAIFACRGDDTIIASGGRDNSNLGGGADRLI